CWRHAPQQPDPAASVQSHRVFHPGHARPGSYCDAPQTPDTGAAASSSLQVDRLSNIAQRVQHQESGGEFNRSTQIYFAVFQQVSGNRAFSSAAHSVSAQIYLTGSESNPIDRSFWGSTGAIADWYFRCYRVAKGSVDHRNKLACQW